jgi:hypothetical protein
MTLPRPIKTVLESEASDAPIARGWVRVQRKRRVRDNVRKGVLAVCCLVLAGAIGWGVRPLFPSRAVVPPAPVVVASPARPALDSIVQQLPKVVARGRAASVQRPVPVVAENVGPVKAEVPVPDVDVVSALLESVREAYDVGDTARAAALLSEIAEKHPDDPRAAQSLYVLGLIQLEKNKDAKSAVASFTQALELSPSAELVPTLWQALERARAAQ